MLCVTIVVQWQMHQDINVAAVSSCGSIGSMIYSPSLSSNEILYDATTQVKLGSIGLYSRVILCATVSKRKRTHHSVVRKYDSLLMSSVIWGPLPGQPMRFSYAPTTKISVVCLYELHSLILFQGCDSTILHFRLVEEVFFCFPAGWALTWHMLVHGLPCIVSQWAAAVELCMHCHMCSVWPSSSNGKWCIKIAMQPPYRHADSLEARSLLHHYLQMKYCMMQQQKRNWTELICTREQFCVQQHQNRNELIMRYCETMSHCQHYLSMKYCMMKQQQWNWTALVCTRE